MARGEEYRTGRTRHRTHRRLFGKPLMVLQYEMKIDAYTQHIPGDGYWPDDTYQHPTVTWWVDATAEDMTVAGG